MRRRTIPGAELAVRSLIALAVLAGFASLLLQRQSVEADHLCAATGSLLGPFDMQTWEARDYRNTYGHALDLAGFNELFPDLPQFALPPLETGNRDAGSTTTEAPYVPPLILKSIAYLESGWAQASYDPLVDYGQVGPVLTSPDCGYGIMQVTSGMQNISGVPSLEQAMIGTHYGFNIARGAGILAEKWNAAPEFRPIVGTRTPQLIEDWYYAIWGYNGFAFKNHPLNPDYSTTRLPYSCGPADDGLGHDRSQYPYQELVLGCVANPPVRAGEPLWTAQPVHLPELTDPKFAEPMKIENWAPCSSQAVCGPMDIPTPNTFHQDPTTVTVSREDVLGGPVAQVSPNSVDLTAGSGGQTPEATITVSNSGTGLLGWRATGVEPWVKVTGMAGVALGADAGSQAGSFTVSADGSSLAPGVYTGHVNVESLYGTNLPLRVTVQLTIGGAGGPPAGDVNCDFRVDAVDGLLVLRYVAALPVDKSQPWCPDIGSGSPRFGDVDCNGDVDAVDALKVLQFVAGVSNALPATCG